MRAPRHSRLPLLVLLTAAVLLFTGCAGSSTSGRQTASPTTTTSTPTAASTSTASSSPTTFSSTDISSLGWVKLSTLAYADTLAGAPGAQNTLYSCTGATSANQPNGAITFSTSADDGISWQTTNTPALAGLCDTLAVSPTAVQDVALYSGTCRGDCGESTQTLYVTTDGGQHWALAASDSSGEAGAVFGWVGTTLFANGAPANTPHAPQQYLARSTNGGPFAWTTLPAVTGQIFADGNTLYAVTGSQISCAAGGGFCSDLWSSADLGTTWSHLTPTYQGNNLWVEAVAADTHALFAYDSRALAGPNSYPLYRSTDSGHTWQPLPQLANGMQADTDARVTPDGTAFVVLVSNTSSGPQPDGIYKLAAGGSAWQLVSPVVPAQVHMIAVQSNAAGHPVALWGLVQVGYERYSLWSHPA